MGRTSRLLWIPAYAGMTKLSSSSLLTVKCQHYLISLSGYLGSSSGHDADSYEVFHSIDAISALVLVELGRIDRNQGLYAEALHKMADAEDRYTNASVLVMGPVDRWPLGGGEAELLPLAMIHEFLTGMHTPAEYVLETFNLLKNSGYDSDWTQVARDCGRLAGAHFLCFPTNPVEVVEEGDESEDEHGDYWEVSEEYVWPEAPRWAGGVLAGDYWEISQALTERTPLTDGQSNTVTWHRFWLIAQGWAFAQLSPSEYRKMLEYYEKKAAESRLKNYFFGSTWSHFPERAQRRLINADNLLNSTQRVALEAITNELRIATEEMCYQVVWQPLTDSKAPPLEFIREKLSLQEQQARSDPGISDYIRICRARWYREFLNTQKLDEDEIRFLTRDLPQDMSQLRSERNLAEHKIGESAAPDSPQSFYRGFLGIGRKGVLPQLARIGHKLQGQHPRQRR